MVFLAYDKVQFAQYDEYQVYALMTPGADSLESARKIEMTSQGDTTLKTLSDKMRVLRHEMAARNEAIVEFCPLVIRAADGVLFDIYMVDEDGLFLECAAGIAEDQVLDTTADLHRKWRW